ncbi:MAG TPA: TrkA family potassium uptake protein [Spirochaetia bacterium]|nr:TrkA family potassium uptake protein [Spirochaetia bacterium]
MRVFIIGGGKRSYFVARSILSKGHIVTIVDKDPEECRHFARRLKAIVVNGDGTLPGVLREAELADADLLLSLTPNDEDNLIACQIAAREFRVRSVFAVVNDPENEEVFHQLGIPSTFSTTAKIASLIEQQTQIEGITNLAPVVDGRLSLAEVRIEADSPAVRRPLRELELPSGSLLVSVLRGEELVVPGGSTVLRAEDRVTFVADAASYSSVVKRLTGKK